MTQTLFDISVLAQSQTALSENRSERLLTATLLEGRATTSNVPCLSADRNFITLSWFPGRAGVKLG